MIADHDQGIAIILNYYVDNVLLAFMAQLLLNHVVTKEKRISSLIVGWLGVSELMRTNKKI